MNREFSATAQDASVGPSSELVASFVKVVPAFTTVVAPVSF